MDFKIFFAISFIGLLVNILGHSMWDAVESTFRNRSEANGFYVSAQFVWTIIWFATAVGIAHSMAVSGS